MCCVLCVVCVVLCCVVLCCVVLCCVVLCCVVCAVVVVVVVVVSDACSTVCLSTAVMPMQQSLKLIGGGSPGSRDSRRPRHPSCV